MTHLHLLCDDGITGELWVSALAAVGADVGELQAAVDRAGLPARLEGCRVEAREVMATTVVIDVDPDAPRLDSPSALAAAIDDAGLPERAHHRARRVAAALSAAEAAVHGLAVDDVRFHELGRTRTIVQLVAGVTALELLEVERVTTSPVAVGGGTIEIAHGRFPVPPPAVLELLRGFVVEGGPRPGELTTPSGAAVLAALATSAPAIPPLRLLAAGRGALGHGAGTRLLTAMLGTPAAETEEAAAETEAAAVHQHAAHGHDAHGHDAHAHGDHGHGDHGHDEHGHGEHGHGVHGHGDHGPPGA
jgi:pyridinium-3,5-bisthiocarboxylic acid mononucleotide nickel chelatase